MKCVEANLQVSRALDTTCYNLWEKWLVDRNDLLNSEFQTTQTEVSLLDAENESKIANVNMDLLLGLPENITLETQPDFFNTIPSIPTFEDYEMQALQNRKDIQASSLRIQSANLGIKSAHAEVLPSLVLTGGYIAGVIPNFVTVTKVANIGLGYQSSWARVWKST